jgi:hypothetical protein
LHAARLIRTGQRRLHQARSLRHGQPAPHHRRCRRDLVATWQPRQLRRGPHPEQPQPNVSFHDVIKALCQRQAADLTRSLQLVGRITTPTNHTPCTPPRVVRDKPAWKTAVSHIISTTCG